MMDKYAPPDRYSPSLRRAPANSKCFGVTGTGGSALSRHLSSHHFSRDFLPGREVGAYISDLTFDIAALSSFGFVIFALEPLL